MSIVINTPLFRYSISVIVIGEDQQYIYYTDGSTIWRKGVRNSEYVIDKTLTGTGFNGIENTDWENVWSIS